MEFRIKSRILTVLSAVSILAGCASPSDVDPYTGKAIGVVGGAAAGAGVAAVLKAPTPVIGISGLAGASLGYYLTTLRFAGEGIYKVNGKVYTLGDYLYMEIPSDNLFEPNTDEFLPGTQFILDSIVNVLARYRDQSNILISGNTSGFGTRQFEHLLSQRRAGKIAFYLWSHGVNNQSGKYDQMYVGYGNNFPIANDIHLRGIRENSNIQIVAYPCNALLHWDSKKHPHYKPINQKTGVAVAEDISYTPGDNDKYGNAFSDDHTPEGKTYAPDYNERNDDVSPPSENSGFTEGQGQVYQNVPTPNYNRVQNDPQTNFGSSPTKHWGYKGDNELQDETPAVPEASAPLLR